jgi:DNA-directed RNA polymerase sigma subunit (sigma70/sigma32)
MTSFIKKAPKRNPNTMLIVRMRMIGYTFAEIGLAFGVTRQRAQQIWKKYIENLN